MAGLDPLIGSAAQLHVFLQLGVRQDVDARIKSAHDELGWYDEK